MLTEKINNVFAESIQTQIALAESIPNNLIEMASRLTACLLRDNKIIVYGHSRAHAVAQILVTNLLNRYQLNRPSFPAVLLNVDNAIASTIISETTLIDLHQKQFNAVAKAKDVLVIISPTGNEEDTLSLTSYANNKEVELLILSGPNHDHIKGFLTTEDMIITIANKNEARIIENFLFVVNTLSELIDHILFSHLTE